MAQPRTPDSPTSPKTGARWRSGAGPRRTVGRVLRVVAGAVLTLLGLLWMLQGADLVRIEPVLCVGECQPVTGGSVTWLAAGGVAVLAGVGVLGGRHLVGTLRRR